MYCDFAVCIVVSWPCELLLVGRFYLLFFSMYCCWLAVFIVVVWSCVKLLVSLYILFRLIITFGWPCLLNVGRVSFLLFGCVYCCWLHVYICWLAWVWFLVGRVFLLFDCVHCFGLPCIIVIVWLYILLLFGLRIVGWP